MPGGAAPVEGGPGFGACAGVKVAALATTTSRLAALAFSDRTIEIRSARAVGDSRVVDAVLVAAGQLGPAR